MSDDWGNVTTTETYNYSDDYYDNENFAPGNGPCSNTDLRAFGKVFLPTLYSMVFILGFIGNGLVVCVLLKYRKRTNLTDICICNLALSDLLFVFTLPFYSHYTVVGQWTFGDFMCRFVSGSHNTGFFSSTFFMVAITLDRYVVIIHAHKVARYRTLSVAITLSVIVWMLSLCFSLPSVIFTKVTNESYGFACGHVAENRAWMLYNIFSINILGLGIPLLVMIVCYSMIIPVLMNMKTAKRHRVIKLIVTLVVVFFLFWTPYNISLFLLYLKAEGKLQCDCSMEKQLKLLTTVAETIAYTHCCLNPIIYAFMGHKFMKRALQMLRKWVPLIPSTRDLSDSSYRKSSVTSRSSDVTSTFVM